jgi:hypothetical protein
MAAAQPVPLSPPRPWRLYLITLRALPRLAPADRAARSWRRGVNPRARHAPRVAGLLEPMPAPRAFASPCACCRAFGRPTQP